MLILSQRILRNEEVGIHTPLPAGLPSGIDEPGSGSRRGGRFRPSSDGKEFLDLGTALRLRGHGDVPTLRAGSFARPAQVERTVVAYDPRNAGTLLRTVLRIRAPRLVAVRRLLTAGRAPSAAVPQRRHDTPAPEAIVRVCIYGYLRGGLHPSGGILRGRTFPTGSVPPAEEGLRSRTETCAPATNPFSHP